MKLERCNNGHYYDKSKHSTCPHCGIDIELDIQKTKSLKNDNSDNVDKTQPRFENHKESSNNESNNNTNYNTNSNIDSENKTIGLYHKSIGIDPVVGWLVCIEGIEKGRDYRIRSGRNFIGRSEKMDINIAGDRGISRERHAVIIYDAKKNKYLINPGDSREMVYVNDDGVYNAIELKINDIIELGETKLIFIPLCGSEFKWD